jgi:hypothetical protein
LAFISYQREKPFLTGYFINEWKRVIFDRALGESSRSGSKKDGGLFCKNTWIRSQSARATDDGSMIQKIE